jgi:hypothetical protein
MTTARCSAAAHSSLPTVHSATPTTPSPAHARTGERSAGVEPLGAGERTAEGVREEWRSAVKGWTGKREQEGEEKDAGC